MLQCRPRDAPPANRIPAHGDGLALFLGVDPHSVVEAFPHRTRLEAAGATLDLLADADDDVRPLGGASLVVQLVVAAVDRWKGVLRAVPVDRAGLAVVAG